MEVVMQVRAEVERTSGKFAPRDEVEAEIREALEGADPGSIYGIGADGDSDYDVNVWEVEEVSTPKAKGGIRPNTKQLLYGEVKRIGDVIAGAEQLLRGGHVDKALPMLEEARTQAYTLSSLVR